MDRTCAIFAGVTQPYSGMFIKVNDIQPLLLPDVTDSRKVQTNNLNKHLNGSQRPHNILLRFHYFERCTPHVIYILFSYTASTVDLSVSFSLLRWRLTPHIIQCHVLNAASTDIVLSWSAAFATGHVAEATYPLKETAKIDKKCTHLTTFIRSHFLAYLPL